MFKRSTGSVGIFGLVTRSKFNKNEVEGMHINSLNKPTGGLWLSPMVQDTSEWVRFCQKEMEERLIECAFYEAKLSLDNVKLFSSPPTKDELMAIKNDESCAGFFLTGIHPGWDVQTLWMKDDRNIKKLKKKGLPVYETV